ncbi:STAS domain-containing protein [Desulfothermus sp.]
MDINVTREEGEKIIIMVKGKINAVTAPEFEKQILSYITNGKIKIILEFSQVDYISSAGLRSILIITKTLMGQGGKLVLSSLKKDVKEIFEISGFTNFIPITESLEEAEKKII